MHVDQILTMFCFALTLRVNCLKVVLVPSMVKTDLLFNQKNQRQMNNERFCLYKSKWSNQMYHFSFISKTVSFFECLAHIRAQWSDNETLKIYAQHDVLKPSEHISSTKLLKNMMTADMCTWLFWKTIFPG